MSQHFELAPEPETGTRDVAEALSTGLLGMIPVAGPLLSSGLVKVFDQEADRRHRQWLGEFVAVVNELIDRVDSFQAESLAGNPEFYDSAIKAARVAASSASAEKHRALQNALFNIGSGDSTLSEDFQSIFLNYIEDLTASHIRLLAFFRLPEKALGPDKTASIKNSSFGSLSNAVLQAFPEWHGEFPLVTALTEGLTSRSLLSLVSLDATMTGGGQLDSRTTTLGDQFLDFISGPFDTPNDDSEGESV